MSIAAVRDSWGDRVRAVQDRAAVDAGRTVRQLHQAAAGIAEERVRQLWPSSTPRSTMRTEAGRWWERTYQDHVFGGGELLDLARLEELTGLLVDRGGAPREPAIRLAAVFGRDAQHVAAAVSAAAIDVAENTMRQQLAELLPRGQRISTVQAVWEQWYARVYRATIAPHVLNQTSLPITGPEVRMVADALSSGRPAQLYKEAYPLIFSREDDLSHAARQAWLGMLSPERRGWLRSQTRKVEALEFREFGDLPRPLQAKLIRQYPPPVVEFEPTPISGEQPPVALAAAIFDAPPIQSLMPDQVNRDTVATRLVDQVARLVDPSWATRARNVAADYLGRASTPRGRSTKLSAAEVERAVSLRRSGKSHAEIAQEMIGCSVNEVAQALSASGQIPGDSVADRRGEDNWTDKRLAAARACLDAGMPRTRVARFFEVSPENLERRLRARDTRQELAHAITNIEHNLAAQHGDRTVHTPPEHPSDARPGMDR